MEWHRHFIMSHVPVLPQIVILRKFRWKLASMKINKGKYYWHSLGRPARGALPSYYSSLIADHGKTEMDLPGQYNFNYYFTTLQEEGRKHFCLPCNSLANEPVTTHSMRRHVPWNSQFMPMDFWFTTAPPKSILCSMKEKSSPLFPRLA